MTKVINLKSPETLLQHIHIHIHIFCILNQYQYLNNLRWIQTKDRREILRSIIRLQNKKLLKHNTQDYSIFDF